MKKCGNKKCDGYDEEYADNCDASGKQDVENCKDYLKAQTAPVDEVPCSDRVMCDAGKNEEVSSKIAEELMGWLKNNCWELEFDHWEGAQVDIKDIILKGINT